MKKNPDARLRALVSDLDRALAGNLRSVILYGSAARGDWTGRTSDLNVMVVVEDGSLGKLTPAAPAQKKWVREGNPPLLFVTSEWIRNSSDVFPLEFTDILDAHQVFHGEDPLAGILISPANLRHQCEHEARSLVLRLRGAWLEAHDRAGRLFDVITGSYGSVATVARAALRISGAPVPPHADDLFDAVARRFGLRPEPFRKAGVLKKEAHRGLGLELMREIFLEYFDQVAALGRAIDGMETARGPETRGGAPGQETVH